MKIECDVARVGAETGRITPRKFKKVQKNTKKYKKIQKETAIHMLSEGQP